MDLVLDRYTIVLSGVRTLSGLLLCKRLDLNRSDIAIWAENEGKDIAVHEQILDKSLAHINLKLSCFNTSVWNLTFPSFDVPKLAAAASQFSQSLFSEARQLCTHNSTQCASSLVHDVIVLLSIFLPKTVCSQKKNTESLTPTAEDYREWWGSNQMTSINW